LFDIEKIRYIYSVRIKTTWRFFMESNPVLKHDASLLAEVLYKMAQERNDLKNDFDNEKYYRAETEAKYKTQQNISHEFAKQAGELQKLVNEQKDYRDKLIADGAALIEQHAKKIKDVRTTLEETIRTLVDEKRSLRERVDKASAECVEYFEDLRLALKILKKHGLTAEYTAAIKRRDNRTQQPSRDYSLTKQERVDLCFATCRGRSICTKGVCGSECPQQWPDKDPNANRKQK
jgi:hypothetical protein